MFAAVDQALVPYMLAFFLEPDLSDLSLQWRNNGRDGVPNHKPRDCLLNPLFRRRSKKTSKFRVTGIDEGNLPVPGEFPVWPVTRKMFPFDDVIMNSVGLSISHTDTDCAYIFC